MKKFLGFTTLSVAGAMLISGILLSLADTNSTAQNPVSNVSHESVEKYQYWLRDYNGYLAVFGSSRFSSAIFPNTINRRCNTALVCRITRS